MSSQDDEWAKPLVFDFRITADWGYYDQSVYNVVFIKRWQAAMRRDMSMLFAEEDEPNLYKVDRYFWENIFDRNEKYYSKDHRFMTTIERIMGEESAWPDMMPLLTRIVLYWSKVGHQINRDVQNLWGENLTEEQRQHAYLAWYANENIPNRTLNHGAIDDDWFIYNFESNPISKQKAVFECRDSFDRVTKTESINIRWAHIAIRQMFKWLGSDEGQAFIKGCERNIEIKEERSKLLRMPQYSKVSPVQTWLAQRFH